jgi:hypothetical protein
LFIIYHIPHRGLDIMSAVIEKPMDHIAHFL